MTGGISHVGVLGLPLCFHSFLKELSGSGNVTHSAASRGEGSVYPVRAVDTHPAVQSIQIELG